MGANSKSRRVKVWCLIPLTPAHPKIKDMSSLSTYRRKRRFEETPEPAPGKTTASSGNRFVIQKHDATRLHYDFRLEIDGVLKSWAVPKGPSMNPADKRLAMETEDHPLEYANFEGVIPEGNYGAGPVIVWDCGTFEPEGEISASEQYRRGEIKFVLHGEKLRGGFVLVRMKRAKGNGKPWLLIKHRDSEADPQWHIEAHDRSVRDGRSIEEVKAGHRLREPSPSAEPRLLDGARKSRMPQRLHPMLATLVDEPFSDPDWLFEIKWDGVRALAWVANGRSELRSRRGQVITRQYPELAVLPQRIRAKTAVLDGEIVALDSTGRSDFQRLQARINLEAPPKLAQQQTPVTYYIFDVLYCDGYDLRRSPLLERKRLLHNVLESRAPIFYADHQLKKGKELFEIARGRGLEGIIGKRASSAYSEARSRDWVKFKITREVDAVVGGYTAPRGSREHFGALLLGLYEGKRLRFIGGVGTGFDQNRQSEIYAKLRRRASKLCPFDNVPNTRETAYWVTPSVVARVKYANWTNDAHLRAPVFLALLDDREATECQFKSEMPSPASTALAGRKAGRRSHKPKTNPEI